MRRGRYKREGDDEVPAAIRQLPDARPTYGCRRITALLNRARRASVAKSLNHKRIYRLMAQGQLLLKRHTGAAWSPRPAASSRRCGGVAARARR